MEEAQIKMVAKNPEQFGAITKTPKFALSANFVKNTPYEARSNDDTIPFMPNMPLHLECRTLQETVINAILSYMYRTGWMGLVLGDAAFHHINPGPNARAGEWDINAGILVQNIAMVRSKG
jgi:hypothetical protein